MQQIFWHSSFAVDTAAPFNIDSSNSQWPDTPCTDNFPKQTKIWKIKKDPTSQQQNVSQQIPLFEIATHSVFV